jgi:LPXTG-motif cell wall-anchored protein
MRRLLPLAGLLGMALLPATASAGTCPALASGLVDKASYRLGELIDFFGTYHDFANPGTVTITFERSSDGASREYIANNSPDGSWYLRFTLDSAADVGRWTVRAVVDQTGAHDTSTVQVTIRPAMGMPATTTTGRTSDETGAAALALAGLLLGATAGLTVLRRRQSPPPRPLP